MYRERERERNVDRNVERNVERERWRLYYRGEQTKKL